MSIHEYLDEGIVVGFEFHGAPKLHDAWGWYKYWGIRYVESGEPITNMAGVEMEKQGNEYVESVQGLYEHRTEKIMGNWYYYHTQWCN